MPKPAIATLYVIGMIVGIIATLVFFIIMGSYNSDAANYASSVNSCITESSPSDDPSTIQANCGDGSSPYSLVSQYRDAMNEAQNAMIGALVFMILAAIPMGIAWIGTLVNLSRVQMWSWFVLTFFFGGVMIFIYLVGGPPVQPRGYGYAWQGAPAGASYAPYSMYLQPAASPAYQSQLQPQAVSPLEVLQQRFARGEIDAATFQQMRAMLEEK